MLRLNNSCCECNPQICLGLRVRRVCAACGQTMAIFHSELPCPILFFNLSIKTDQNHSLLSLFELERNFYQFHAPALSGATRSLPSFLSLCSGEGNIQKFFSPPFSRFEKKNLKKTIQFVGRTKQVLLRCKYERGEKVSAPRPEDIFSTLSGDGVSRRIAHAYILIRGCSCYKL